MLSDRHCDCEVVVRQIRAHCLVSKHHIETHNRILGVFGPLKEHIDVNVLDKIKLFLRGNDILFIIFRLLLFFNDSIFAFTLCFRVGLGGSFFGVFLLSTRGASRLV